MRLKIFRFFSACLIVILLALLAFYLLVAFTYKEGFTYGTWVNGIYCTGKSVDEINTELIALSDDSVFTITTSKVDPRAYVVSTETEFTSIDENVNLFKTEIIDLNKLNYSIDYTESLNNLYNHQNPYLWFLNLSRSYINDYIKPVISLNSDLLFNELSKLPVIEAYNVSLVQDVSIHYDLDGYYLTDTRSETLDIYTLYDAVFKAIINGEDEINIDDLFIEPVSSESIDKTLKLWDKLDKFLETKIIYDMGAEIIPIDKKVLSSFIVRDGSDFKYNEDGSFYINEDNVNIYVHSICEMYDTYGKERTYTTFNGEEKHIKKSLYGTKLDEKAESEYLINAIKNNVKENHIPTYEKKGYARGLNDIGSEFIEVDLTNQKLYYIKDNKLVLDTDVVTGKPSMGYATPELLCFVYKKAEKAILRGEDYASPVDYWMAIYGAIGLHDASWQSKFGGNRYLTHGSRGCINMKNADAKLLYESIEVGIPVVVYK